MKLNSILLIFLIAFSSVLNAAFREDVTLHVPSEYATIHDALYDLDEKTISREVTVTIQVEDGNYTINDLLEISHPNGCRIKIIGNLANPEQAILQFTSSTGIFVRNGASIALIDGFKILGPGSSILHSNGIHAQHNGSIKLGANIIIDGWYSGLVSTWSSYISCASGITVKNCYQGIYAYGNSIIYSDNATVSNNDYGLFSIRNSYIQCNNAIVSNNTIGAFADLMSGIEIIGTNFNGNQTDKQNTRDSKIY